MNNFLPGKPRKNGTETAYSWTSFVQVTGVLVGSFWVSQRVGRFQVDVERTRFGFTKWVF